MMDGGERLHSGLMYNKASLSCIKTLAMNMILKLKIKADTVEMKLDV